MIWEIIGIYYQFYESLYWLYIYIWITGQIWAIGKFCHARTRSASKFTTDTSTHWWIWHIRNIYFRDVSNYGDVLSILRITMSTLYILVNIFESLDNDERSAKFATLIPDLRVNSPLILIRSGAPENIFSRYEKLWGFTINFKNRYTDFIYPGKCIWITEQWCEDWAIRKFCRARTWSANKFIIDTH